MDRVEPPIEGAELLSFLREIGWYPGRQVDLAADLEEWEASGYSVSDAVRRWMGECGGLEFEYPRHSSVGGVMDSMGAIYGGYDHFLCKVADDGYRALLATWKREPVLRL